MKVGDKPLPRSFFNRDTLTVCSDLIGKRLVRKTRGDNRVAGVIAEIEAYCGEADLACHARAGRTKRNQSMWGPPGSAYMFFTYGMHWMFNIVTEPQGSPAAILIRALFPTEGVRHMRSRRPGIPFQSLTDGPAKLCQALSLDGRWDGYDLTATGAKLFVENISLGTISLATTGPRVGLNNVPEPWKSMPWRFRISSEQYHHFAEGGVEG